MNIGAVRQTNRDLLQFTRTEGGLYFKTPYTWTPHQVWVAAGGENSVTFNNLDGREYLYRISYRGGRVPGVGNHPDVLMFPNNDRVATHYAYTYLQSEVGSGSITSAAVPYASNTTAGIALTGVDGGTYNLANGRIREAAEVIMFMRYGYKCVCRSNMVAGLAPTGDYVPRGYKAHQVCWDPDGSGSTNMTSLVIERSGGSTFSAGSKIILERMYV